MTRIPLALDAQLLAVATPLAISPLVHVDGCILKLTRTNP
jgi:hypothetical protein